MCGADWGVAEVGAAGPTFHPSADADSGFTVVAVAGPPRNAADDGSAVDRVCGALVRDWPRAERRKHVAVRCGGGGAVRTMRRG